MARAAGYEDARVYRAVLEVARPEGGVQRSVHGPYRTASAARGVITRELRGYWYRGREVQTRVETAALNWEAVQSTDVSRPKGDANA